MLTSHSCWKRRSVCSNSRQCFSHALSRGGVGGKLLCKMLKLKLIGAKRIKKVQFNRAPAIPVDPVCSTQQAQRMSPSTIFFFSRRSDINFNKCEPCNANPQKRNVPKLWMHLIYVPWQHSLSPYSTKVTWQAQAAWTVGAHRPDEASQLIAWHKRNQRSLLALDVTVKKCGKPGSFGKCWFFLCYACIVNLTSAKFSNTIKIKSHVCSWSWFLDCFPSLFSVKLISKGGTQSSVILGEGQWKLSRWSSEAMLRGMTTSQ